MVLFNSTIEFFAQANDKAGLITFATILVMMLTGMTSLDFSPRSLVRWMIYLDAFAFVVYYSGSMFLDGISPCAFQGIG